MQISEDSGKSWHDIPDWVNFFLKQGEDWVANLGTRGRTIRIISMPCRSHAASLITLGAVSRCLCEQEATDRSRHLDNLFSYAKQYLHHCKACRFKPCNPKTANCGYISEATGKIRLSSRQVNNRYISEKTDFINRIFVYQQGAVTVSTFIDSPRLLDFYPEHGIPLSEGIKGDALDATGYVDIFPDIIPINDNLSTSFSGLCLAGTPRGRAEAKRFYSNFLFKRTKINSLVNFLPINGWSERLKVSRLVYLNTHGGMDYSHQPNNPYLVIADGASAFMKILNEKHLENSDIIAVVTRDGKGESDKLLHATLEGLSQWYQSTESSVSAPPGIYAVDYDERLSQ